MLNIYSFVASLKKKQGRKYEIIGARELTFIECMAARRCDSGIQYTRRKTLITYRTLVDIIQTTLVAWTAKASRPTWKMVRRLT